jgi:hypothetical protein
VPEDDAARSVEQSQQPTLVHFRYRPIARDMWLDDEVANLKEAETGISLTIRQQRKDEQNFAPGNAVVEVACVRSIPARAISDALKTGELSCKKQAVQTASQGMYSFARRALKVIRWRQGVSGHPDPIRWGDPLQWSLDGVNWKGCADALHIGFGYMVAHKKWSETIAASVGELVLGNNAEPLSHELLHEAEELFRTRNLRSAVVIAVAAAEVGFKHFVAELRPECEWLLLNVPSPSLEKMLTDFLPIIPVRRKIRDKLPAIPPSILGQIKKANTLRNQIVHGRSVAVKENTVVETLPRLKDFLYLMDFWLGMEWAWENIQYKTQQELVA